MDTTVHGSNCAWTQLLHTIERDGVTDFDKDRVTEFVSNYNILLKGMRWLIWWGWGDRFWWGWCDWFCDQLLHTVERDEVTDFVFSCYILKEMGLLILMGMGWPILCSTVTYCWKRWDDWFWWGWGDWLCVQLLLTVERDGMTDFDGDEVTDFVSNCYILLKEMGWPILMGVRWLILCPAVTYCWKRWNDRFWWGWGDWFCVQLLHTVERDGMTDFDGGEVTDFVSSCYILLKEMEWPILMGMRWLILCLTVTYCWKRWNDRLWWGWGDWFCVQLLHTVERDGVTDFVVDEFDATHNSQLESVIT